MSEEWNLRRRVTLSGGEIAYDVLGFGPPILLVHGTPSRSYIWRDVALRLADRFSVYAFDLLGFGQSERREGLDLSISAQACLLAELVETLGLDTPSIAGHDIGGAIALRSHLLEGVPFGTKKIQVLRRSAACDPLTTRDGARMASRSTQPAHPGAVPSAWPQA